MYILESFEEIPVDKQHSEIIIPVLHVELYLNVRYFISTKAGYCSLLINDVKGKGLRGKIEAAAAKAYIGRTIFIFLSILDDGKKLITVPALFEKEPSFNEKVDLSGLVINAYYHNDFKRTVQEVYEEHVNALTGKNVSSDSAYLCKSILELPGKGIEILRSYK